MKRYKNTFSYGQWLGLDEDEDGDLVKYEDVEQLQALTKELLYALKGNEVFISSREKMHIHGRELQEDLIGKVQQYLGSLKEDS